MLSNMHKYTRISEIQWEGERQRQKDENQLMRQLWDKLTTDNHVVVKVSSVSIVPS